MNNGYSWNTDDIIRVTDDAVTRDTELFGEMQYAEDTNIIFCDDKQLLSKLGGDHDTRTLLFPSKKNYIVISDEFCNADILAHELTHAELHTRLNKKALKNIPTWWGFLYVRSATASYSASSSAMTSTAALSGIPD